MIRRALYMAAEALCLLGLFGSLFGASWIACGFGFAGVCAP